MTNAAIAVAEDTQSGLETTNDARTAVRLDWTPESFALQVEREGQMRHILHEYMSKAMKKDHHYYSFSKDAKPAITQEGAHAIASLMKCTFGPPVIDKTFHDDGHLTAIVTVDIFNQQGVRVGTGDGICSTRESKYAYRWLWRNELPVGCDTSLMKTRGKPENPQYQMPNQDLPDLYNTVLKMAVKRAKVAAVRQLPLVSELFVAEEDGESNAQRTIQNAQSAKPKAAPAAEPAKKASSVETAVLLATKLQERGIEFEELVMQFLPEGTADFKDLTDEQAATLVPSMSELLNAKLKEK